MKSIDGSRAAVARTVGLTTLVIVFAVTGCASAPHTDAPREESRRSIRAADEAIVLWWSKFADSVTHITHVVNDVWVGPQAAAPALDPAKHQDAWLERGVTPLDWAGGRVYADQGSDALVDRWSNQLNEGYLGLAIDEFGAPDDETDAVLHEALLRLHRLHPDATIAVWHAGLIDREAARVYREAADLVLLEAYVGGRRALGITLGPRLANVRRHGLEARTVAVIAVDRERFADSVPDVEAQIGWLIRNTEGFAGIGVYGSRASELLIRAADSAIGEHLR